MLQPYQFGDIYNNANAYQPLTGPTNIFGGGSPFSSADTPDAPSSGPIYGGTGSSNWAANLAKIAGALGQAGQVFGGAAKSGAQGQLDQANYQLRADTQAEQNARDAFSAGTTQAEQELKNRAFANTAGANAAGQTNLANFLKNVKAMQLGNMPPGVRTPSAGPFPGIFAGMNATAPTYADLATKTAASADNLPTVPNFVPAPVTPPPKTSAMQKGESGLGTFLSVIGALAPLLAFL